MKTTSKHDSTYPIITNIFEAFAISNTQIKSTNIPFSPIYYHYFIIIYLCSQSQHYISGATNEKSVNRVKLSSQHIQSQTRSKKENTLTTLWLLYRRRWSDLIVLRFLPRLDSNPPWVQPAICPRIEKAVARSWSVHKAVICWGNHSHRPSWLHAISRECSST